MKSKKMLSGVMAGAIALSLAVPAFAAQETEIEAAYSEPVISVSVPASAIATINPYKLPVKFIYDSTGKLKADQSAKPATGDVTIQSKDSAVASQPMMMFNLGDSALDVSAAISLQVPDGSELKFVADKTSITSTTAPLTSKSIYLTVEGKDGGATGKGLIADTTKPDELDISKYKTLWEALTWTGATASNPAAATGTPVAKKIGTLQQATIAADGGITIGDKGTMAIRLAGEAVESPKTPWSESDTFTATIAYSFKVVANVT